MRNGKFVGWTEAEVTMLREAYALGPEAVAIDLTGLAVRLGRDKSNVCRKARQLGLTNQRRPKLPATERKERRPRFATKAELAAAQSKQRKEWLANNPHPRGMLGKKHSPEGLRRVSEGVRKVQAGMTRADWHARSVKSAKTRAASIAEGRFVNERKGCTWKAGWREIGRHRKYFRSRWEANYARYLQFLLERGEIADWEHEPETFWFDGIKRGACSYLPDFRVVDASGTSYHEVKGWMDARSRTKLRRMKKYHPKVRVVLVEQKQYAEIGRKLGRLIPGWE